MDEHLQLLFGVFSDFHYLAFSQLAGKDCEIDVRKGVDAMIIHQRCLRGGVDPQLGKIFPDQGSEENLLDDHPVNAKKICLLQCLEPKRKLDVPHQGVEGEEHFYFAEMRIGDEILQFLHGEILREAAGIEELDAKINSVCSVR